MIVMPLDDRDVPLRPSREYTTMVIHLMAIPNAAQYLGLETTEDGGKCERCTYLHRKSGQTSE